MADCEDLRNLSWKLEEIGESISPEKIPEELEFGEHLKELSKLVYEYERIINKGKEKKEFVNLWKEFKHKLKQEGDKN
jgi:hypothetical protein